MYFLCRQDMKKAFGRKIAKCWTLDGIDYAAATREARGTVLRSEADFNAFIALVRN